MFKLPEVITLDIKGIIKVGFITRYGISDHSLVFKH